MLSNEEKEYIKNNVIGKTCNELTTLLNNEFDKNYSTKTIRNYKKANRLKSGVNTKFKKEQQPHNKKEIGAEFIGSNGYTYVKNEFNKWEQKQRYIYRKYKGSIPKGYSVVFANQTKDDFNLDNLILINDRDKLVMKNKHLFYENKELTKNGILIAQIINKISDLKKITKEKIR